MVADVLIIGGGLAGYAAAYEIARGSTLRVSLLKTGAGASPYIHGFCMPLDVLDSPELFYADTMASGYGQSDPELVRKLCFGSLELEGYFHELGVALDRDETGYRLLKPLGSSRPRVASIENKSGPVLLAELRRRLLKNNNYREHVSLRATELLLTEGRVTGALCFDTQREKWLQYRAETVILASGGFCGIYPFSTNSPDIGGDGTSMAFTAGAKLADMEFIQFEPCVSVTPAKTAGKGVITTMFYDGAVLRNTHGERFMLEYSEAGERVPKDILSRCIYEELKKGGGTHSGGVYLDATGVPEEKLLREYLPYVNRYHDCGIDIAKEYMEVAPAPHTSCGGVVIDTHCRTSVPGLLACGEVTGGLHGANRLGGNAGLETLVFGRSAGQTAIGQVESGGVDGDEEEYTNIPFDIDTAPLRKRLQGALSSGLNVTRDASGLAQGLENVEKVMEQLGDCSGCYEKTRLQNDCLTAKLALMSALERTETVGCHVRSDEAFSPHEGKYRVTMQKSGGQLSVRREQIELPKKEWL